MGQFALGDFAGGITAKQRARKGQLPAVGVVRKILMRHTGESGRAAAKTKIAGSARSPAISHRSSERWGIKMTQCFTASLSSLIFEVTFVTPSVSSASAIA